MLTLETSIQQLAKVELSSYKINDLVSGLPALGRAIALQAAADLIEQLQEQQFAEVQAGLREIVCERRPGSTLLTGAGRGSPEASVSPVGIAATFRIAQVYLPPRIHARPRIADARPRRFARVR